MLFGCMECCRFACLCVLHNDLTLYDDHCMVMNRVICRIVMERSICVNLLRAGRHITAHHIEIRIVT